jgi:acyl-CoA dehydrogenase
MLKPLMNGEIIAFLMTEPVALPTPPTSRRASRERRCYVINGRKWWSSGVAIPAQDRDLMGKTDPNAASISSSRKSWCRFTVSRSKKCPVFGDDAPHVARCCWRTLRFGSNILLGEGRVLKLGPLGPGRIHHCMRTIGVPKKRWKNGQAPVVAHRLRQENHRALGVGSASARPAPTSR